MTARDARARPRVSVVICTWNRAASLAQTLEGMTRLRVSPEGIWELLVVNNNCTDATDRVVAGFADRLPVRVLHEPAPGLANARNRAIPEARGDYVLWTDDDVLVEETWLAAYLRAFETWPDAAFFGGPIEPLLMGRPPSWLARVLPRIGSVFGRCDFGPEPRPLARDVTPFGANFAVRRPEQLRYRFDPGLGTRPGVYLTGEETNVMWRLLDAGYAGRWVPDARLRHLVPPEHQTVRFVRRYFTGRGRFFAEAGRDDPGPRWGGVPRWAWREALAAEAGYRVRRLFGRPESWIGALERAGVAWGTVRAFGEARRSPGAAPVLRPGSP